MAKLKPRYDKYELETLLMCIKPSEKWSQQECASWAREKTGFRHFDAPNITPIKHSWPKPPATYPEPYRKPAA